MQGKLTVSSIRTQYQHRAPSKGAAPCCWETAEVPSAKSIKAIISNLGGVRHKKDYGRVMMATRKFTHVQAMVNEALTMVR